MEQKVLNAMSEEFTKIMMIWLLTKRKNKSLKQTS